MTGITNGACAIKWRYCLLATAALMLMTTAAALAQSNEFKMERIDPSTINTHPAYSQVTVVTGPSKLIFVAGQIDRPID
jgi:enamine deaminase RidA (YjgF/YER057c/UK114 family)